MSAPVLVLEMRDDSIYFSACDRRHVLEAITFMVKVYEKLEERGQRQFAVHDVREGEG